MNFLRRNKNDLNRWVFDEADFSVLNYEQFIKVNGAGGSSSGGGGGPSGSGSSSSGNLSDKGYSSSTEGIITNLHSH